MPSGVLTGLLSATGHDAAPHGADHGVSAALGGDLHAATHTSFASFFPDVSLPVATGHDHFLPDVWPVQGHDHGHEAAGPLAQFAQTDVGTVGGRRQFSSFEKKADKE